MSSSVVRYAGSCLVAIGLLAGVAGCSGDESAKPSAAPATSSETDPGPAGSDAEPAPQSDVSGQPSQISGGTGATGALAGRIRFDGELPPPRKIQATKDVDVCSKGEGEVQDVVVKDGNLVGAVVELTVKGGDRNFETPEAGFVIRQKNCRFSSRLLVAFDGAELTIHNDDPVPHNVNSGQWNVVQGPGTEAIKQKLAFGGSSFERVTCNIHAWMETWVYVARTPFYSASGDDGSFSIEGIPPGKYRGTVTHPTLGKKRISVTIEAGQTTEEDVTFEAP